MLAGSQTTAGQVMQDGWLFQLGGMQVLLAERGVLAGSQTTAGQVMQDGWLSQLGSMQVLLAYTQQTAQSD